MNKIIFRFTPICVLGLSGCITPYQTNFDCPVAIGVPCTSMTKINHMIDKGILGKPDAHTSSNELDQDSRKVYITHFKSKMESVVAPQIEPLAELGLIQEAFTLPWQSIESTIDNSHPEDAITSTDSCPASACTSLSFEEDNFDLDRDLFDSTELTQPTMEVTDVREPS